MSKKDKSLHEKMKQFFSKRETVPLNFDKLKKEPYSLSSDILKDISSENMLNHRLKSLKELYDIVLTNKLEDGAVEAICKNIQDLLGIQNAIDTRHMVLQFYCALIQGQLDHMDIMRAYIFKLIVDHNIQEDILPRLDMLKSLTDNGKVISYFEEEIGPFLLHWFPLVVASGRISEFLPLLTNVIKFNAAYLDDEVISGFIKYTCALCSKTKVDEDIQKSLNLLDAVLCYSHIPDYSLQSFIYTLCLTVNVKNFSQSSWKILRNLLGTNVGHTSIFTLCLILQDEKNYSQTCLVRGAVFFISMALWGSNKVPSLTHSPTAILPSFLKVLDSNDDTIAYEIILSLQRLVKENGNSLRTLCWEKIFDIIEKILEYPQFQNYTQPIPVLAKAVHDLITAAEESCSESSYDRLYNIIEKCSSGRTEESVIRLILHNAEGISPFKEDFFLILSKLLEKYFKSDKRNSVQLEALKLVHKIRSSYVHFFEDDVMDQNILPFMSHTDGVVDVGVRKEAVELLTDIAESCSSNWFVDILDIFEKVIKMPENSSDGCYVRPTDVNKESYSDVLAAVQGIINVFKKKLFVLPSNHCIGIYNLLISHVKQHYHHLSCSSEVVKIRKMVLEFLLQFRTNNQRQIGICMNDSIEYSVYISCESGISKDTNDSAPASPLPASPVSSVPQIISHLSYEEAFQVIIMCLKQEKDWTVLEMVLNELPKLLQNKALIIKGKCNIAALCITLYTMVSDKNMGFPESLKNTPPRLTRTEVQSRIFPCLSALTSYYSHMESHVQRMLIRCLQSGLVSRSAKICMEGLTLCTLEMQNSMVKLLPDVLLKLSKISATVGVSVSVLEFLSNLIRLPHLYVSFVEDQYMSIFAIALPYTNPFKFSQYTVALAHHVIAMWFLKCRIPFRKDFAKFITKGLRNNISIPCDETQSSNFRNDSSAQNEENIGKAEMSSAAIIALHTELMETGLDLMARFTFGMASNVPKRSPVSEFLLEKGQKTSWLVGNKIVTITTSGCGTKSFKYGLCERCYSSCQDINKSTESEENDSLFLEPEIPVSQDKEQFTFERKRHRSAIQRRNTTLSREMLTSANRTKDDILLHFQGHPVSDLSARRHTSFVPDDGTSLYSPHPQWASEAKDKENKNGHLCSCWCASWAEVHIRRPTGNTSWMMKIQNQLFLPSSPPDIPLSVLTSLVLPQKGDLEIDNSLLSSTEEEYVDIDSELCESSCDGGIEITPCPKSKHTMRRTNSSPDMNSGWSNFESFEKDQKALYEDQSDLNKNSIEYQDKPSDDSEKSAQRRPKPLNLKQNLKLDLTDANKADELPSRRGLNFRTDSINSAPIEKWQGNNEIQQQSSTVGSFRDRGYTISVMSPIRPTGNENSVKRPELNRRSGMSPSFVFLQLFHNSCFGPATNKPLLLLQTEANNRALNVLDHIPPYDTHKIGVVYVGPGQENDEVAILNNVYGSARYVSFLRGLGNFVRLTDVDPHTTYLGGLDTRGEDGKFALIWHDDVMQVVFHVATLMLNKESDTKGTEKKKHIANDSVMIVYNESGEDYKLATIKGHVTNACVVICPEDFNSNVVSVKLKTKELLDTFGHSESYIVSDESLPVFVRQMALHANLASLIISRRQQSSKYSHVSNWLERLRTIKRLRSKVLEELKNRNDMQGFESSTDVSYDDFTDYV